MKAPPQPGFVLVAAREIRWLRRDRVALVLIFLVPLIAVAVLAGTFSRAVIRGIGVIVVDADRTPTSLQVVQTIGAAPEIAITRRADDLSAATQAIRSGEAIAAAYIPPHFERDLTAGRRPQIVVFYNTQYYTPGNTAARTLRGAIDAAASAINPSELSRFASGVRLPPVTAGPLVVEQYVLTNPETNFAQFLLRALAPTVLHVVIAVATGYAVGSEFSRRSLRGWLRCAGGRPLIALAGKLAPLFAVFLLWFAALAGMLHGLFQLPFRGDAVLVGVSACLLILAYQGLAALIQLLAGNLALGLSLIGIVVSPAFGYAGVGFPVLGMQTFPRVWGALLPVRWYLQLLFDQAARGAPVSDSAVPFAILAGMAFLFPALAWLRLRRVAAKPARRHPAGPTPEIVAGPGIGGAFAAEWRRVLADERLLTFFVLGPLLYGVFYPQPYLGQILRDVPVAVVDSDRTPLSRELIQMLDAHEAIAVALRPNTLAEAQQALFERRIFAILDIPQDTEREVLKGNRARLAAYVDATYFILYNRTLQGISDTAAVVSTDRLTSGGRPDASLSKAGLVSLSPVELLMEPLFNPTGGYGSYVAPAAFVLILQQMLLMGAAMLGGIAFETGGRRARGARGTVLAVLGQSVAQLTLFLPAAVYLLVLMPRVYGFSTLGRLPDLFLMAVPFLLATSLMGQAAGAWFEHRETAVVLFIATSLPQFFLAGAAWPTEAIPPFLQTVGQIFPSNFALDGLVRINQMGASLAEVSQDWAALWVQVIVYFVLAVLSSRFGSHGEARHGR